MKRSVLLITAIAGIQLLSYGQFKAGLKGGVNIADIIISKSDTLFSDETFQTRYSYHIGCFIQQSFSESFGWEIDVLFSNKGYIHKYSGQTTNVSLNYLNWPILLTYKPTNFLEFELGPELGYLISGESLVKNFDLGIDIGARFNLSRKINAGLRYCHGFPFKMNIDQSLTNGYVPYYQNNVFQVYLGFIIARETPTANK